MKIYFDMDGVLANLNGRIREFGIEPPYELFKTRKFNEREKIKIISDAWHTVERIDGFWSGIVPLPGAAQMLHRASLMGDLYVLSKMPNPRHFVGCDVYSQSIKSDKIRWAMQHFPEYFSRKNILIVSDSKAASVGNINGDILIDDLPGNITDWKKNGGIGIYHTSVANTLAQLNEIKMR